MELAPRFQPPPDDLTVTGRTLHVWAIPMTGDAEALRELLCGDEQSRASRFRFEEHRRRYTISHAALRLILGRYCDTEPQSVQFLFGVRGKPRLIERPDLHFNLSHSGHLALVAVAGAELGVDMEKVRFMQNQRDIARQHFSAGECRALDGLDDDKRSRGFYSCWTRKEAVLKALGDAAPLALESFDVAVHPEDPPQVLAFREGGEAPADWSLLDVSPADDYVGAVAVRGKGWQPQFWRWEA